MTQVDTGNCSVWVVGAGRLKPRLLRSLPSQADGGQTEQLQTRLPSDGPRAHQLAANH